MITSIRYIFSHYLLSIIFFSNVYSQNFNVKPYLQNVTPSSIHIMWETTSNDESIVHWGETTELVYTATGDAENSINSYYIHDVHLTDLDQNTRYYYKVVTGDLESEIFDFVTPIGSEFESSLRVIAMSDMQKDYSNFNKFQEIINQGIFSYLDISDTLLLTDVLDLVLIPGDLVDNGINHTEWGDHFFGPSEPLFSHVPLYPVLGNHENNSSYYFSYFNLPENGTPGYEEHWWWADFSNVRVIGLNSNWNYQLAVQLNWLENVLNSSCNDSNIDFVFAQLHHPHRSELWVPGETNFTGDVVELLEQFTSDCGKPSIHFFGHTHGYSRGQSINHTHAMVNVATAGGAIDYWGEYLQADYPEYSVSQDEWGFVVLDVEAGSDPKFTLKRISRGDDYQPLDNVVRDEFTIRMHNNPPMTPDPVYPLDDEIPPDLIWLWASEYSDPDNDEHGFSQWQISTNCGDFEFPVADIYESHENWYYGTNTQEGNSLNNELITGLDGEMEYCWRVRYRDKGLQWSEWSEPSFFTTTQSLYTPNLLLNPGAENGTSNWIVAEGIFESLEEYECNGIVPHSGEYYFCVGGLCTESDYAEVYQNIDISEFSDCIDDSGASTVFGGFLANWSGWDEPEMHITFLAEDGSELGASETQSTLNSSWTEFDLTLPIPPYSREIKFTLMGTRNGGQDNDSYFDDLFLRLIREESCMEYASTLDDEPNIPKEITLYQNYPNPFNPLTTISYDLPQDSYVVLSIYDMKGSLVKNLVNEIRTAGMQSIQWNATNNIGLTVSAGVYLYSIETKDFRKTKKMILLK